MAARDFEVICRTFADAGYRFGALVIDAELFVPQSRPRLFIVGVRGDAAIPTDLIATSPAAPFQPRALTRAADGLPPDAKDSMVWWRLTLPRVRTRGLGDLLDDEAADGDADALLTLMSPRHRRKVEAAGATGRRIVGAVYRRTRRDASGAKLQRAEVRFDGLAGCLRTPAGGSSRQTLLVVEGDRVRARLISARETARLMGLDDGYILPSGYTDAYHLTGDGVVAPVVRHLAEHLFEPLIRDPAFEREVA